MKVDGSCHCGAITYEAEVDPNGVVICHCDDCQTFSGSPYRTSVPVPADKLKLKGQPKIYVKTAESGNKRAQAFCGNCGSSIYSSAAVDPTVYSIRFGSIRQRAELAPPSRQIWHDSAHDWPMNIDGITKIAGQV